MEESTPPGASWCAMEHPERCEHSERGISGFLMNGWMKVQDGQRINSLLANHRPTPNFGGP